MTLSTVRTIVIPASTPQLGGFSLALPLRWPMAEPDEVLDYSIDVSAVLADVGDSIVSASLSVSPSGAGELTAQSLNVVAGVITGWLAGGVAGRNYVVRIEAVTDGGRTFEWFIRLLIDPWSASWPPSAPIDDGFGTSVTWGSAGGLFDSSGNPLTDSAGNILSAA